MVRSSAGHRLRDVRRHVAWAALWNAPSARRVEMSLLAAIFLYGALLRFEALYRKYNSVLVSESLAELQAGLAAFASSIRPASFLWETDEALTVGHYPYWGDQRGYIGLANAAGTFYESGIREPLFVFSTRIALAVTGGREIGLSMMTTTFSAMVPLATYALGRAVGGPVAGLSAALLVAIHRDMIAWGTDGWRGDLFTSLTVLFAYGCVRMYQRPSRRRAGLVGVLGALACLTRITALSFVVPTLLALAFVGERRGRWQPNRHAVLAGVVVLVVVAPYLINCWIDYGDPLYSISFATEFYLNAAGAEDAEAIGIGAYLSSRFADEPVQATDSLLRGLTVYPWSNKWRGLRAHWGRGLAIAVATLSIVGLLAWMWTGEGRLLLLIYFSSLVPLAMNWELGGGSAWRFTMHAYPFIVVAAAYAAAASARLSWGMWRGRTHASTWLRKSYRRVLVTALLVTALGGFVYVLPLVDMGYALARGRSFSVAAGPRDAILFRSGWHPRERPGNQTVRYVEQGLGTMWIPLRAGRPYSLVLRLHPTAELGDGLLEAEVRLNGTTLRRIGLRYDPRRIGAYPVDVPSTVVRTGFNLLEVEAMPEEPRDDRDRAFLLWYVRVEP